MYFWDKQYLFMVCADFMIHRSIIESEMMAILKACHSYKFNGHIVVFEELQKFSIVDTIGLIFIEMLMSWSRCVLNAKFNAS